MKETLATKWDERYNHVDYAYGVNPNNYLKEKIDQLKIGKILFPAEGEGRNAVYAAQLGWEVSAFDLSKSGKKKALKLAETKSVKINYAIGELHNLDYKEEQFDAIALIYAHFPANIKSVYHKLLDKYLRKGGIIIFEAFSKKHLEYILKNEKVGGPKDVETLFSLEEIISDFPNYTFQELVEMEITLSEGNYHNGKGSVIRFMATKK